MRKTIALLASALFIHLTYSQNVGIGTSTPHPSAQLDVTSNSKGMLVPRLNTSQRNAIATPATGLLVFDTDTNSFWYYNGSSWINLLSMNSGWSIKGNSGTNPATNFIGTTDSNSLLFKVYNQPAGYIGGLGDGNVFWGFHAGDSNRSYSNVGIGIGALSKNTIKSNLVAIGDSALYNNGIGSVYSYDGTFNTGVGSKTLYNNTTGNANSAFGYNSMYANTTGYSNTANGAYSLFYNTAGYQNTATGDSALTLNTTGYQNTANGAGALYSNTIGNGNTANGYRSLYHNNSGNYNTANGFNSLFANISGAQNTANGYYALYSNTIGLGNNAIGYSAMYFNTTGINNAALGTFALDNNTNGGYNVACGSASLLNNTIGSYNIGLGASALINNNTGNRNCAIGAFTLAANFSGSDNSALGDSAEVRFANTNNATAIGAHSRVDCSNCMVLGSVIGVFGATSNVNIGIGENNPGFPLNFGSIVGDKISLWGNSGNHHGFGIQSGLLQMHTDINTSDIAFGYGSSSSFSENMRIKGNGNVGIGTTAPINRLDIAGLNNWDLNGTEGDVRIGNGSYRLKIGVALFGGGAGSTGLMQYGQTGGYNVLYLGSQGNAVLYINGTTSRAGIGTDNPSEKLEVMGIVKAASFIATSDATLKKEIKPIDHALQEITQLNGYNYYWKDESQDSSLQAGVLAQEVQKVLPELVKKDNKGLLGVNYQGMIPYLIEALKEQVQKMKEQDRKIDELQNQIRKLQSSSK